LASFFTIGEKKVRPGIYFRYENWGTPPIAGAADGRCGAVFRSNWGPLAKPVAIENFSHIARVYGEGGTTSVALEQFRGGARLVFAMRLGDASTATAGSYLIEDTDIAPVAVLRLVMRYPGSRQFSVTIRPTLDNPAVGELLLLDDTTVLEKFTFDISAGADQVNGLLEATRKSSYFTLVKLADSTEPLAVVDQDPVTPGTDPLVNVAAYSAAFEALEASRWNVLAMDTSNLSVQVLMQMYLNRVYQSGKFVMGVVGEDSSVPLETRMLHASAFNDYRLVYVGSGFVDLTGEVYEGWKAAARVAGMIAGTPSNESITHAPIAGATELVEQLTNFQYESAILAGMLTFSTSAANTVWVEQGINSLVLPGSNDDVGWKKIKRVKVRFELMQRLNDTIELLVGRINNDPDGRMTVVQSGNGVCNAMVAERKLLGGAHCVLDPDNAPAGDSAWFLVYADDIDALEKMYFTFKFRFAPDEQ